MSFTPPTRNPLRYPRVYGTSGVSPGAPFLRMNAATSALKGSRSAAAWRTAACSGVMPPSWMVVVPWLR